MKRRANQSIFIQNAHLYIYGIVFNGVGVLVSGSNERSFFSGYSAWTIAIIAVQTVSGMVIGALFKYLDNIVVVFAHAVAMILTAMVSMIAFGFQPHLEFICGVGVSSISLYLYYVDPNELGKRSPYARVNQEE